VRVRTAVTVVVLFFIVKLAMTWVALNTWASYPEHPGGSHHWHIELGPLAEWLAAVAAAGAAMAALHIARRDRQQRIAERHDEDMAQARLVHVRLSEWSNRPDVNVTVQDFGSLPLLDVTLVAARWTQHLDARCVVEENKNGKNVLVELAQADVRQRVLLPTTNAYERANDRRAEFRFYFVHPADNRPLRTPDTDGPTAAYKNPTLVKTDLMTVLVEVQFTTANGVRWEVEATGAGSKEPRRL
jgi:hypothetical protein